MEKNPQRFRVFDIRTDMRLQRLADSSLTKKPQKSYPFKTGTGTRTWKQTLSTGSRCTTSVVVFTKCSMSFPT